MSPEKRVIAVAGMPGSGKSLVVKIAVQNGYDVVAMGDEVRQETKRRNMALTPENIGKIMIELRQSEGEAVIAKKCLPKIEKAAKSRIIVDGIRSLTEVEEFRKHFKKFALVAIHSPPETRFKRLYNRQRSDDPRNWSIFHERDLRELSVGLGNAIAMAEYNVVNEEDLASAKDKTREVLRKVETKWMQ